MSDSVSDISKLFSLVEIALAARTLYGFCRTYFSHKLSMKDVAGSDHHQYGANTSTTTMSVIDTKDRSSVRISTELSTKPRRPIRVYMDGCFDVMHFGHANALRQARALGDELIVGVCSGSEIARHKGPPVMSDDERVAAVTAIKWVKGVIRDVPYVLTDAFLHDLIHKHGVDLIVHGDDPCLAADGGDAYAAVKRAGRFRTVKRTEGVSSTDVVGRMLSSTVDHHVHESTSTISSNTTHFLPTSRRLAQFAGAAKAPRSTDRVVYIDGSFDLLHSGHLETLRRARALGDFLLVGVHNDDTVHRRKGLNMPFMNVHERSLMVLACRYVDEVIIGAPWVVTRDLITSMNISIVVHGSHRSGTKSSMRGSPALEEPYAIPREMGILRRISSASDLSVEKILQRIVHNRDAYVERNEKKEKGELEYVTKFKTYVEEA